MCYLVAQPGGGLPVSRHHLEDEGGDGGGEDVVGEAGLLQPHALLLGLLPVGPHLQQPRHHARLLAAAHVRVRVQHRAHQSRPAPAQSRQSNTQNLFSFKNLHTVFQPAAVSSEPTWALPQ